MGWPSRRWAGVRATVCAVALGLLGACGQATPAELACAERPGELPLLRCGFGACATFVPACDAEGRPTVCRAPEPTETEVTDGFDNNCDGAVDETAFCPVGSRKSCYGGSRGTRGRGICSDGTQGCSAGRWGACVGERFPELELPDGLDNDCDGEIDEGLPCATAGAQQSCFAGPATSKSEGACQVGTQTCALTREGLLRWGACLGQVTPNPERCDGVSADGIDNDCDGLTDEDCSCIEGSPCYHGPVGAGGRGTCRVGVASCWADGAWRACVGEVYPSEELCDGLDNDCNGVTDDLYVGQVDPAPSCDVPGRVGICKEGAIRCRDGKFTCVAQYASTIERCDGLDNDCDGLADNSTEDEGGRCPTTLLGECQVGVVRCERAKLLCLPSVEPMSEVCDGRDNDCDGRVDEDAQGVGASCIYELGRGECRRGASRCADGRLACMQATFPQPEFCNGLDDDCNGLVDDGFPEAGTNCLTGLPGVCSLGGWRCVGGKLTCIQVAVPSAEVCDGVDNDCNGLLDEGDPGGGASCATPGVAGVCVPGELRCAAGRLVCEGYVKPAARLESCNGLDDDCNGRVDDVVGGCP